MGRLHRLKAVAVHIDLVDGRSLYCAGQGAVILEDSQTKGDKGKPAPPATRAVSLTMRVDSEEFLSNE